MANGILNVTTHCYAINGKQKGKFRNAILNLKRMREHAIHPSNIHSTLATFN